MRLHLAGLMVMVGMVAGCTAAAADVLEIGSGGDVRVRRGAADVQWVSPDAVATAGAGSNAPGTLPAAAVTAIDTPPVPPAWQDALFAAAARYRVSPDLLAALVWQESRWHAQAVSPRGAIGLTQLMPDTARLLAVDARDPAANLEGGAHYLRLLLDRFDGDVERALAAYNAGPGRVISAGGIPRIAETRAYVSTIIDRLSPALTGSSQ